MEELDQLLTASRVRSDRVGTDEAPLKTRMERVSIAVHCPMERKDGRKVGACFEMLCWVIDRLGGGSGVARRVAWTDVWAEIEVGAFESSEETEGSWWARVGMWACKGVTVFRWPSSKREKLKREQFFPDERVLRCWASSPCRQRRKNSGGGEEKCSLHRVNLALLDVGPTAREWAVLEQSWRGIGIGFGFVPALVERGQQWQKRFVSVTSSGKGDCSISSCRVF